MAHGAMAGAGPELGSTFTCLGESWRFPISLPLAACPGASGTTALLNTGRKIFHLSKEKYFVLVHPRRTEERFCLLGAHKI